MERYRGHSPKGAKIRQRKEKNIKTNWRKHANM